MRAIGPDGADTVEAELRSTEGATPKEQNVPASPQHDSLPEPLSPHSSATQSGKSVEVHACVRNLRMLLPERGFEIDMHVA